MDCEFPGLKLWLLRGIPRRCTELEAIKTLMQLGVSRPDFWYMPRIRKPEFQNRGYAFLGYACAGDHEAQHIIHRIATCSCPWPLELEKSTLTVENMENNTKIWEELVVAQGIGDKGGMQHQTFSPHQPEGSQPKPLQGGQQEIHQLKTKNPLYAHSRFAVDWQSLIQRKRFMQGKIAVPNVRTYTVDPDEFDFYNHGCGRIRSSLDLASTAIMGVPVFFF
eukprot:TRINITY_DN13411_c0_g3_i1.p1 TRINITY_DN13411_c0_g3~~TRINITY_DN13411_c0_g3_i1.p1  ORF type:complete len:221 (+),score=25.81 TRINITY_DN13411_c0_g3_i1:148-810(+)